MKPYYDTINTTASIPTAVQKSGTIVTLGMGVIGSGTDFVTDAKVGDFIYDYTSQNEVRKITEVLSPSQVTIESAFTVDIASAIDLRVISSDTLFDNLYLMNVTGGNGVVEGKVFYGNTKVSYSGDGEKVDAITVNGTGTVIVVSN